MLRLPESVRQALAEGEISEGQARPLINLEKATIDEILPTLLKEEWSARKIEQYIAGLKKTTRGPADSDSKKVVHVPYEADTKRLTDRLKTEVSVKTSAKGAGQIIIRFKDDSEFHRIQKLLDQ